MLMASVRAMIERRRSTRVWIRIPVQVVADGPHGQPVDTPAEATAVSLHGALLRVPFSPVLGSRLEVRNDVSQETREFRVVRLSAPGANGLVELGVEILYPSRNFWGVPFPGEHFVA
jgi:PilZ domain